MIEVAGERRLVPLDRIEVRRPASVRWHPKEERQGQPAWIARRRFETAQKKAAAREARQQPPSTRHSGRKAKETSE